MKFRKPKYLASNNVNYIDKNLSLLAYRTGKFIIKVCFKIKRHARLWSSDSPHKFSREQWPRKLHEKSNKAVKYKQRMFAKPLNVGCTPLADVKSFLEVKNYVASPQDIC